MSRRSARFGPVRGIAATVALLRVATLAAAQDPALALKPPDLSSPRATLKTFLDSTDAVAAFVVREDAGAPSREKFDRFAALAAIPIRGLDLSEVAPAARLETGRAAAVAFPSQTLYLGRDRLTGDARAEDATAKVRARREEGSQP